MQSEFGRRKEKMKNKVILVWFRNDLRFHDNEALHEAIEKNAIVIPIYCFDDRYYKTNNYNNKNTGIVRANFIRDSVIELKERLNQLNSDLLVYKGLPEEILPRLVAKYEVDEVYHHREVASRETEISDNVESALWTEQQVNLKHFIGHTLFHKEDLPFPVREIPESFNKFKKHAERESFVREPLPALTTILTPTHLEKTNVPTLEELGFTSEEIGEFNNTLIKSKGGELAGLEILDKLTTLNFWKENDYTLLSPYIANGLISPIYTYHKIQKSELNENKKIFEKANDVLLWRDYFRFMLKKHPDIFFRSQKNDPLTEVELTKWKNGKTGIDTIDKGILLLKQTGSIPYSLRKLIGIHLIQDIGADWLQGASFFEEHLLDYEPATNYGYWAHLAGEGTSKKENSQPNWKNILKEFEAAIVKK